MTIQKESQERWHIGKEIPIAMVAGLCIQTGGGIWWAATMAAKMDSLSYQVASLVADKYTQHDAMKDKELMNEKFSYIERRLESVGDRHGR